MNTVAPGSRLHGLDGSSVQAVIAVAKALEAGHAAVASRAIAPLLAAYPQHPEVLRLQAGILNLVGNYAAAETVIRAALARRPDDPFYYTTLGSILGARDDLDGAVAALQRACELQPDLAVAWYDLGVMLTHCVRYEDAIDALRRAVALSPAYMDARALLADMLRTQGRIDEATRLYRGIIAEKPTSGMAWWGLADIKVNKFDADDIAQMRRAISSPEISQYDVVPLGFALAKALDDSGRYADALSALAQANATARKNVQWSATAFAEDIDRSLSTFSGSIAVATDRELGREAIFVVSLPRSGSTLVEQILASHSQVEGAGELPDVPLTLTAESKRRGVRFPDWAPQATAEDWTRLGREYMARTAHWRAGRHRFVDKLPSNWMYIGAIHAMLPAARIIVCRRDPLETCFSCYRQYLAGNEYARTFDGLAGFWRGFDRSARFWATRLPQVVYEHSYEQLVATPEAATKGLLDFCGLPFEDQCLRFYENRREVRSPSATQVRQPLRRDTARSDVYGTLLDPLRKALGLPAHQATV